VSFIGILGTGLVFGMTAARYLHIFFLRQVSNSKCNKIGQDSSASSRDRRPSLNTSSMSKTTDRGIWLFSVTLFWLIVWILANAIPVFNSLLNISAALLLSWFTWGATVLFWFHLNWNGRWRSSSRKLATAALNAGIMCLVLFMMVPGMYASIDALMGVFEDPEQKVNGAFTCADNSIV
jgi:hypothetical protein